MKQDLLFKFLIKKQKNYGKKRLKIKNVEITESMLSMSPCAKQNVRAQYMDFLQLYSDLLYITTIHKSLRKLKNLFKHYSLSSQ